MKTWQPTKETAEDVISAFGSPSYLYNIDTMIESYNDIREPFYQFINLIFY